MKQAILIIMILAGAPVEATQPMTPFPALPSQQTLQQAEQKDSVSFPFLFRLRQTLQANDPIIDPGGDDEDLIQPLAVNDEWYIFLIMTLLALLIKNRKIRKE